MQYPIHCKLHNILPQIITIYHYKSNQPSINKIIMSKGYFFERSHWLDNNLTQLQITTTTRLHLFVITTQSLNLLLAFSIQWLDIIYHYESMREGVFTRRERLFKWLCGNKIKLIKTNYLIFFDETHCNVLYDTEKWMTLLS